MIRRVSYQNWIADIGFNPVDINNIMLEYRPVKPNRKIISAVQQALGKLTSREREIIMRYYFEGESLDHIAVAIGKQVNQVATIHRRAVNKLKRFLAIFVKNEFGIKNELTKNCPLCNSVDKNEINKIIKTKKEEETWRRTILELKKKYRIIIKSPQILIGHQKYHI